MSIKLVFQDNKDNTLHEKDFTQEGGATMIPGQGDLVQIPGGEQIKVMSRRFVYPDSEEGHIDVQVIFVCEKVAKPAGGNKKVTGY